MTPAFEWFASGVELPSLDYRQLEQWIVRVADSYNRIVRTVNYIFCDDEEILKVNRRFLNHDYYTDIITFDYCSGCRPLPYHLATAPYSIILNYFSLEMTPTGIEPVLPP